MRNCLVYLSGPITGLTYEEAAEWREYVIQHAIQPHSVQC